MNIGEPPWMKLRTLQEEELRERIEQEKRRLYEEWKRSQPLPGPSQKELALSKANHDLAKKAQAARHTMLALMEAIKQDLAKIRASCICSCPEGVPATDCPKNTLAQTMGVMVRIAMEEMERK